MKQARCYVGHFISGCENGFELQGASVSALHGYQQVVKLWKEYPPTHPHFFRLQPCYEEVGTQELDFIVEVIVPSTNPVRGYGPSAESAQSNASHVSQYVCNAMFQYVMPISISELDVVQSE